MKLNREVKVGIVTIIAIFLVYFGLNFLRGIDIFSPFNRYYGSYETIDGLVQSSPVYIKGCKVGQVSDIAYDFEQQRSFVVAISIDEKIALPQGTIMELFDDGLMGGKAVRLVYPEVHSNALCQDKDTLSTSLDGGLLNDVVGGLLPQISTALSHVDSLVCAVQTLVAGDELKHSLASIEHITADLSVSSAQLKTLMNREVPALLGDAQVAVADFRVLSGNLSKVDFAATMAKVDGTMDNVHQITTAINGNEGTLGLLLNDKQLYLNLNSTVSDADKLLVDLKQSPKRYVHFSLFGGKNKTEK